MYPQHPFTNWSGKKRKDSNAQHASAIAAQTVVFKYTATVCMCMCALMYVCECVAYFGGLMSDHMLFVRKRVHNPAATST